MYKCVYYSALALGGILLSDGLGGRAPAQEAPAQPLVLETLKVYDPLAQTQAGTLLMPQGWKAEGGVVWRWNWVNLANLEMRCRDPQGLRQVEFFPQIPFVGQTGPWIADFPVGSNYLGQEVRPPVLDPREYVRRIILPRFRRGVSVRVVGYKELPDLAKATAAKGRAEGLAGVVRAGRVRVEYVVGGQAVEEDFYCVVGGLNAPLVRSVYWGTDQMYSVRAAKGQLDADTPLLLTVANSRRIELAWFNQYQRARETWFAIAKQNSDAAVERSKIMARTQAEISDIIRASYEKRQAALDRIHRQFSDYIRGVERYRSPAATHPVELPSSYRYVWGNALGQYVLSNNANYNPNVGGTGNWQRLERVK